MLSLSLWVGAVQSTRLHLLRRFALVSNFRHWFAHTGAEDNCRYQVLPLICWQMPRDASELLHSICLHMFCREVGWLQALHWIRSQVFSYSVMTGGSVLHLGLCSDSFKQSTEAQHFIWDSAFDVFSSVLGLYVWADALHSIRLHVFLSSLFWCVALHLICLQILWN